MRVTPFPRRSHLARRAEGLTLTALVVSACATGVITDPGRNGSGVNLAGSGGAAADAAMIASGGAAGDSAGGSAGEAVDAGDEGGDSQETDAGDGGPVVDEGALPPCLRTIPVS